MDRRFSPMLKRVGMGFYRQYIGAVREAVREDLIGSLIRRVTAERRDITTVEFRIRAMASAVRQGYDY
jgi:hypothetical protein